PRTTACDCERSMEPGLPQKLYLMADTALQRRIEAPNNCLKQLLVDKPDDDAALDELFLATLSRLPTEKERASFHRHRETKKDRRAAFADTLWALVNTTELIFNH